MVEELYRRYAALTGDPQAAAMLVLAHSNIQGRMMERMDAGEGEVLLTAKEAAERLRVHVSKVYELCREGTLPHVRVGSAIRVRAGDLGSLQGAKVPAPTPDPTAYVPTHLPVRRPRGGRRQASAAKPA